MNHSMYIDQQKLLPKQIKAFFYTYYHVYILSFSLSDIHVLKVDSIHFLSALKQCEGYSSEWSIYYETEICSPSFFVNEMKIA